jgi:hypothetical protein
MTDTIQADLMALERQEGEETIRLAEENRRLNAENRRLRNAERRRELTLYLGSLRERGQLTPAMELAGVEEALLAAEELPGSVVFADGQSLPLGHVLRNVLSAIPSSSLGEDYSAKFAAEAPRAARLSADEQRIAVQLGLSEEEFASLREE